MTSSYPLPTVLRPQAALGDFQDFVKRVAGEDAYLDIPRRLEPKSRMYRIAEYFQSAKKEDFDSIPLVQGSLDSFFTDSPIGTYRLGFWGHGINSYGLYIQSRTKRSAVFLRMPFGGHFGDDLEHLSMANRYLGMLDNILDDCEKRGIDIEVCESMGFGRYRLITASGQGVEFKESLYHSPNAAARFKKMMAMFAVEINRRKKMQQFIDDDIGYKDWLRNNPGSFVINTYRNPSPDYLVLHNSDCPTISKDEENYTHGDYQKTCDQNRRPLSRWAQETTGNEPTECSICFG